MVSLSRKVDYALIGLAHLIQNPNRVVSAREVADLHALPLPLLMKILKRLHCHCVLNSTRGVKGGYQIAIDLDELSLGRLIDMVDGMDGQREPGTRRLSTQPSVQALQYKLVGVLRDVKVTDLVKPGRRIDVPVERVGIATRERTVLA